MYTANTMASAIEAMGMTLPYSSSIPAVDAAKPEECVRAGKAMRACAINREAAALQGIRVSRMLALSFALSAALGAIAGILITPTQYIAFNLGIPFAISGFIAAIVGGFGRPFGAFLGGLALGVTQAAAVVALGAGYKNPAALTVLLLFLFLRPQGILGAAK